MTGNQIYCKEVDIETFLKLKVCNEIRDRARPSRKVKI